MHCKVVDVNTGGGGAGSLTKMKCDNMGAITLPSLDSHATLALRLSPSRLLILGGILASSDSKTQCVVGLPGDVIQDGGCPNSYGTYKGKASGS